MLKVAAITLTFAAGAAMAGPRSSGGGYVIDWYTMDGGGGTSSGGVYELSGTIGQPDAAPPLAGGAYDLEPGFWPGAGVLNHCLCDLDYNGVLNLDDIDAFATGFIAGNLAVDFDFNGVLNLDDIDAFAQCFLHGCP
ncbi:MAG: hypothetical protein R3B49_01350 [Phycisphaerales bacterium]